MPLDSPVFSSRAVVDGVCFLLLHIGGLKWLLLRNPLPRRNRPPRNRRRRSPLPRGRRRRSPLPRRPAGEEVRCQEAGGEEEACCQEAGGEEGRCQEAGSEEEACGEEEAGREESSEEEAGCQEGCEEEACGKEKGCEKEACGKEKGCEKACGKESREKACGKESGQEEACSQEEARGKESCEACCETGGSPGASRCCTFNRCSSWPEVVAQPGGCLAISDRLASFLSSCGPPGWAARSLHRDQAAHPRLISPLTPSPLAGRQPETVLASLCAMHNINYILLTILILINTMS